MVGDGGDRCCAFLDGGEDGGGGAAAGIPAGCGGQAHDRPGTGRAVPLLAAAAEHDPQSLPDVEVDSPAAVRFGDRDFPAGRSGPRRGRWGSHCRGDLVPRQPSTHTVHSRATACQRDEYGDGDRGPVSAHIIMTCQAMGRFRR